MSLSHQATGAVLPGADPALLNARSGRWQWQWVLLGTALALGSMWTVVPLVTGTFDDLVSALAGYRRVADSFVQGRLDSYLTYASYHIGLLIVTILVLRLVHGQSWRFGLGADLRFDWTLFGKAALAYLIFSVVTNGIELVRDPGSFAWQRHRPGHLLWLLLAMVMILPQAFAEDYLFQGYLVRVWGALIPLRIVVVPAVAAVFTIVHAGNADMRVDLLFNLISMLILNVLAFAVFVRTGSLGATTGMHWMNNVFATCFIAMANVPGGEIALLEFEDRVVRAGGSHLMRPQSWIEMLLGVAFLWALVSWRRSPLYLGPANGSRPS